MTTLTKSRFAAALLGAALSASAASAGVLDVTDVTTNPTSWPSLTVSGSPVTTVATGASVDGSYPAVAIGLTVSGQPKTVWVFCVDLIHDIVVTSYNPAIQYETGTVTTDSTGALSGTGNPLTRTISGEIATLADIGDRIAYSANPNAADLTAIQGAIWAVEYDATVTGDGLDTVIGNYVAYARAHPAAGYANAVYSVGSTPGAYGTSQGFTYGVPEPATWTMMIVGTGLLGADLRRRRRAASRAALA